MSRIIAIANQKGGVGKTTTAVNLAACLAIAEQPTLLVDCDSQANATAAIGFTKDPARKTLYHTLIAGEPFEKIIQKSQVNRLDVVPADKNPSRRMAPRPTRTAVAAPSRSPLDGLHHVGHPEIRHVHHMMRALIKLFAFVQKL